MLEEFPSGLFQDFNSAPGYVQNMFYQTSIEEIPDMFLVQYFKH